MSRGVRASATSDREPDWWIQDVEVLDIVDQKEPVCSHLALLQRSVVQGVELVRGLVLKENAAGREKGVPRPIDSEEGLDT
jgi:hypothetical protein